MGRYVMDKGGELIVDGKLYSIWVWKFYKTTVYVALFDINRRDYLIEERVVLPRQWFEHGSGTWTDKKSGRVFERIR